jgi:hypothetical protein
MATPRSSSHQHARRVSAGAVLGVGLAWLFLGIVLFARAMAQPFSHDEHQFIAAGWWLAKAGLLPYRDFPYHHMPYQVPFNALAVILSPYVLLSGRVVSWLAAWIASGLLAAAVWGEFRRRSRLLAAAASGVAALVFVSQPIVAYTTGQAWNHDASGLLALAAVVIQLRLIDGRASDRWGMVVGLLAGLAAGVRLSYAVLCPLLLVSAAAIPGTRRQRGKNAARVLVGILIAGIPAGVLLGIDPKAFGYGNVLYPQLNSLYRDVLRYWAENGLGSQLGFFIERVLARPANAALLVGSTALATIGLAARSQDPRLRHRLALVLSSTLVLFLTAFVPNPTWTQYFYACVPFAILTCGTAAAGVDASGWRRAALVGAALVAMVSIGGGTWDLPGLRRLQSPATWVPIQVHEFGQRLAEEVPAGPVLTLAPVLAMEGGLATYEAFATGPFTWRVAHIIPEPNRRRVGWIGRDELEAYLADRPPAAVVTGLETENDGFDPGRRGTLEEPLDDYAAHAGYRPLEWMVGFRESEIRVWIAPGVP